MIGEVVINIILSIIGTILIGLSQGWTFAFGLLCLAIFIKTPQIKK